jgi:hypothetical protein
MAAAPHGPRARLTSAAALACAVGVLACQPPSLDDKPCPCAAGYTPCQPAASSACVCLRADEICVGADPWTLSTAPTAPVPMDAVTVFAFSQVDTGSDVMNVDDPQLFDPNFHADIVIRAWGQWDKFGVNAVDYQFSYVSRMHSMTSIRFMGGGTATVLFRDQFTTSAQDQAEYDDFTTCDAAGDRVAHTQIQYAPRRGTLANPKFRDYIIGIGQVQIDGGVDGLSFEEVNGTYQGAGTQATVGDEGFDDYHLADFNKYLLASNPPGTDFAARFGMSAGNRLRADVPPWDLTRNFDYRKYLAEHGWAQSPFADDNPLGPVWGRTTVNRPSAGAPTFVDTAEPYVYWKEIVERLRAYARDTYNRDLLISAEGIWPFVDFQSVGIDLNNTDGDDGGPFDYIPTTADGRLAGGRSIQPQLVRLKQKAEQFAPGAPVVMFFDGRQDEYDGFPADGSDHQDYWRLYGAEAYANGIFPAFQLKSSVGADDVEATATQLGLMPLFESLSSFYQAHARLYHGVAPSAARATTSIGAGDMAAMVAVNDHPAPVAGAPPVERDVHVVNHVYVPGSGIVSQADVTVSVDSDRAPAVVALASPDLDADVASVPFTYDGAQVTVTLPTLAAYSVIMISY